MTRVGQRARGAVSTGDSTPCYTHTIHFSILLLIVVNVSLRPTLLPLSCHSWHTREPSKDNICAGHRFRVWLGCVCCIQTESFAFSKTTHNEQPYLIYISHSVSAAKNGTDRDTSTSRGGVSWSSSLQSARSTRVTLSCLSIPVSPPTLIVHVLVFPLLYRVRMIIFKNWVKGWRRRHLHATINQLYKWTSRPVISIRTVRQPKLHHIATPRGFKSISSISKCVSIFVNRRQEL